MRGRITYPTLWKNLLRRLRHWGFAAVLPPKVATCLPGSSRFCMRGDWLSQDKGPAWYRFYGVTTVLSQSHPWETVIPIRPSIPQLWFSTNKIHILLVHALHADRRSQRASAYGYSKQSLYDWRDLSRQNQLNPPSGVGVAVTRAGCSLSQPQWIYRAALTLSISTFLLAWGT